MSNRIKGITVDIGGYDVLLMGGVLLGGYLAPASTAF